MTEPKNVIVLTIDSRGGLFVKNAPEGTLIVLKDYQQGEDLCGGNDPGDPDFTEEIEDMGGEIELDVVMGVDGYGKELRGNDVFVRYVVTENGACRPGMYGCDLNAEDRAKMDALYLEHGTKY